MRSEDFSGSMVNMPTQSELDKSVNQPDAHIVTIWIKPTSDLHTVKWKELKMCSKCHVNITKDHYQFKPKITSPVDNTITTNNKYADSL